MYKSTNNLTIPHVASRHLKTEVFRHQTINTGQHTNYSVRDGLNVEHFAPLVYRHELLHQMVS